jgi:glucosamine--fructose-6-phosphate aminotransferase (isomerizing)
MHLAPTGNPEALPQPPPPAAESTALFREAAEAGDVVERQLARISGPLERAVSDLEASPRQGIVTLARGSSDHAATYAKYLFETRLGLLTTSAAPSVSSLYASGAHLRNTIVLVISQSGKSPDLLASVEAALYSGARVIALVNVEDSPLARMVDHVVPLCAGRENSVAATKSFIASLSALAQLVALWSGDDDLRTALESLPDGLRRAWQLDWSDAVTRLRNKESLYVVGRGIGLGIAQEAALKLKETCGLHAEAFSSAELRHGPLAIVRPGFPVFAFGQDDETLEGIRELLQDLDARGAEVMAAGIGGRHGVNLPATAADPVLQPILHIESFYRMVNALALARGYDPDRPRHLSKVTETL